jgi:hypothetical protein
MSHVQMICALCYALVALGAMVAFWFNVYPSERAESPTPPRPIQYVGTALIVFMLGAFWGITGPAAGVMALIKKFRK